MNLPDAAPAVLTMEADIWVERADPSSGGGTVLGFVNNGGRVTVHLHGDGSITALEVIVKPGSDDAFTTHSTGTRALDRFAQELGLTAATVKLDVDGRTITDTALKVPLVLESPSS